MSVDRISAISLFSGGGGLDEGLRDWFKPVLYCESDRFAQGVLLSRMARGEIDRAPIWDDVRTLRSGLLGAERALAIVGGFPCQDISVAGAGRGLDGERSGLFFEVVRLVEEIKPAFIFLENVPAIRTRGGERVGKELARLGFDLRWGTLSASDVGAPHLRNRWWCLAAHTERLPCGGEALADPLFPRWEGFGSKCQLGGGEGAWKISGPCWWAAEPAMGRVAHGVAHRSDRIRVLGNGVVPAQAREAFIRLAGINRGES
jgi:DNA (cytosine-5)-methyltransferase 1